MISPLNCVPEQIGISRDHEQALTRTTYSDEVTLREDRHEVVPAGAGRAIGVPPVPSVLGDADTALFMWFRRAHLSDVDLNPGA